MKSEAPCCGGGLSGNCLLINHSYFNFKSKIFPFSQNFKHLPTPSPTFYTLKTFEKSSKNSEIIIELRAVT